MPASRYVCPDCGEAFLSADIRAQHEQHCDGE
jgi:predicted RNA-binding Zn-ribbon protein involved in translation (DUF1610 family)